MCRGAADVRITRSARARPTRSGAPECHRRRHRACRSNAGRDGGYAFTAALAEQFGGCSVSDEPIRCDDLHTRPRIDRGVDQRARNPRRGIHTPLCRQYGPGDVQREHQQPLAEPEFVAAATDQARPHISERREPDAGQRVFDLALDAVVEDARRRVRAVVT